jgi:spermidine synthase
VAFFLAFCSLSYEFILIQVITSLQGGQIHKYNLTISLFTFFLGLGTLFSDLVPFISIRKRLFQIEVLLCSIGILAPIVSLYLNSIPICYFAIVAIAFLSGFELPLLMRFKPKNEYQIIGMDYIGMFASAFLVPIIFLHWFGVGPTLILAVCINITVGARILFVNKKSTFFQLAGHSLVLTLVGLVSGFAFYRHEFINHFLSTLYLN